MIYFTTDNLINVLIGITQRPVLGFKLDSEISQKDDILATKTSFLNTDFILHYSMRNNNFSYTATHHRGQQFEIGGSKMRQKSSFIAGQMGTTPVVCPNSRQRSSNNNASTKAVNKFTLSEKKAQAGKKVKELEEFQQKWESETDTISRLVRLEGELGREHTYQDIVSRFNPSEIEAVSDHIGWLYPNWKEVIMS